MTCHHPCAKDLIIIGFMKDWIIGYVMDKIKLVEYMMNMIQKIWYIRFDKKLCGWVGDK